MRENQIARCGGEGIANEFAESHEDGMAWLLVVRHAPPIFVFAGKNRRIGHNRLQPQTRSAVGDAGTRKMFVFM
jgi:hypothetical protein